MAIGILWAVAGAKNFCLGKQTSRQQSQKHAWVETVVANARSDRPAVQVRLLKKNEFPRSRKFLWKLTELENCRALKRAEKAWQSARKNIWTNGCRSGASRKIGLIVHGIVSPNLDRALAVVSKESEPSRQFAQTSTTLATNCRCSMSKPS